MVAYSFKARFAEPILDETKGGTIRADRRRHARPGEALQLYTGMRTHQCRLVARQTCLAVEPIRIDVAANWIEVGGTQINDILDPLALDLFARFDGFRDWADMQGFWWDTYSQDIFSGWHIRWAPFPVGLEMGR